MRFLSILIVTLPLAAAPAVAKDVQAVLETEIEGDAVLDGQADERLREIGRRAARENLAVQVSAPDLWEQRILEPIRAGAGDTELTVKFVNALTDTVRITAIPADQAVDPLEALKQVTQNAKLHAAEIEQQQNGQPREQPARAPAQERQRPDIERPSTDIPEMKVERPSAVLPESGLARQGGTPTGQGPSATATDAERPRASAGADSGSTTDARQASAHGDDAEARRAERELFERLYNQGRGIDVRLPAAELEPGDLVFEGDFHRVAVRRGISSQAYWLEGEPPADRMEHLERNKYRVVRPMPEPRPQPESVEEAGVAEPPGVAAERERFEELYNRGDEITESVAPDDLKPGDALYVGRNVTAVVRREGVGLATYWLGAPLRLDQPGIAHETKNKYVVVGNIQN